MNSDSGNESESSLPTQPILTFPSSPPIPTQSDVSFEKLDKMDDAPGPKSEPASQNPEAPRPPLRRVSSEETERPPSAQQSNKNFDREDEEEDDVDEKDTDEEEIDSDPAVQIDAFDWDQLHQRYHDAMNGCHTHEEELTQEWESLMNVHIHISQFA
jgi:hypothetical protein